MKKSIEGWILNDYDGYFSPDAQSHNGQTWLSINLNDDITVTEYQERYYDVIFPIFVMAEFIVMCERWKQLRRNNYKQ